MFKKNNKLLALAATAAIILPISTASAVTLNIDAVAKFLTAITLGNAVNMDFGSVEFSGAPIAGSNVDLGTDGNKAHSGVFSGSATGTVGQIEVTGGTNAAVVNVFCDATATMAETGGGTIGITAIEVVAIGSEAAFGSGSSCNGTGGAAATNLTIGALASDTFKFGGRIDGGVTSGFVAGDYSTATAGGTNVKINVFYQ